jgi:AcrR family transcriptional regulator
LTITAITAKRRVERTAAPSPRIVLSPAGIIDGRIPLPLILVKAQFFLTFITNCIIVTVNTLSVIESFKGGSMPKTFGPEERETIRRELIIRGTELFSRYGLRKCTIDEIARAAGIAKGTFYLFYPSKEEFFFVCMEQLELTVQTKEILPILTGPEPLQTKLERLLLFQFRMPTDYPFFSHLFNREEYAALMRGLPPERIAAHREEDEREIDQFITALTAGNNNSAVSGKLLNGLFRATVMLNLHREEIGPDIFEEVIGLLAKTLAAGLAGILSKGENQ